MGGGSRLLLKPTEANQPAAVDLLYGKLRAQVKKSAFQVGTSAAVTGVRGTEFFVSSEDGRDFVCTLDGVVEVESKASGQKLSVPAKTGVEIRPGAALAMGPTPEDLVNKWKNDTDTRFFTPVVMDTYGQSDVRFHPLSANLFWGLRASLNTTAAENLAYTGLDMPPSLRFLQSRISPAIKWGHKYQLTWIPRLLVHLSNEPILLDANPVVIKNSFQKFDLGELFTETEWHEVRVRLGLQNLNWDNGFYFSNNYWQLEPQLFPALRLNYHQGKNFVELVSIGRGEVGKLNSQTPVDMIVFKYEHSNWLSVFGGHRDYARNQSDEPAFSRGHRFNELGATWSDRTKAFDFKLGGMIQKGELFEGSAMESSLNTHMWDLQAGFYPLRKQSLRLAVQWIEASENFVPGFENPYNLGFSQIVPRSNVTQYRGKVSFTPRDNDWVLALEGIRNHSVGTGQLTLWQGNRKHMLDEIDLSWSKSWPPSLQTIVSAIWFNPTAAMSATSPMYSKKAGAGFMIYTQYVY